MAQEGSKKTQPFSGHRTPVKGESASVRSITPLAPPSSFSPLGGRLVQPLSGGSDSRFKPTPLFPLSLIHCFILVAWGSSVGGSVRTLPWRGRRGTDTGLIFWSSALPVTTDCGLSPPCEFRAVYGHRALRTVRVGLSNCAWPSSFPLSLSPLVSVSLSPS